MGRSVRDEKAHQKLSCFMNYESRHFNLRQVQGELKRRFRRMGREGMGDMTRKKDPPWMKDSHVAAKRIKAELSNKIRMYWNAAAIDT